jgi:hypothetical protein
LFGDALSRDDRDALAAIGMVDHLSSPPLSAPRRAVVRIRYGNHT